MSQFSEQNSQSLSIAYIRQLLQLGRRWGLSDSAMLAGTDLPAESCMNQLTRVRSAQKLRLAQNIVRLSGHTDLGFAFGMNCKLVAHGPVIYAAMSCATLQDALDLLNKYGWIRQAGLYFDTWVEGPFQVVAVGGKSLEGPFGEVAAEGMLSIIYRLVCFLVGAPHLPAIEIRLTWPEPDYYRNYRDMLPTVCWLQPGNEICIPRELLAEELVTANPAALLQAIGMIEQGRTVGGSRSENMIARIQTILCTSLHDSPTLPDVAAHLRISTSTLKRRLKNCNQTYQNLLDGVRAEEAQRLMQDQELQLHEISRLLGFGNPANFTKAFRRWNGMNPSDARKKNL